MSPLTSIVTPDGLRLAVTSAGTEPPRVVVPNGAYFADALAPIWARHPALVYDLRNRGASDPVAEATRLERGVLQDMDDLETVRRSLGADQIDLIAHSYVGVVAMLYAAAHPARVRRAVLLSPAPPDPAIHPAPSPDDTMRRVFTRLAQWQQSPPPGDAEARCRAFWEVLAEIYVADSAHAAAVRSWGRCDLPNERAFLGYWTAHVEPSLRKAAPSDRDLGRVTCPVLVVHGTADRSAQYEGGRAWARRLPDARLLTLDGAAHAPWIERRDEVLEAVATFLDGAWPPAAKAVAT
jgi:pimeloyl-ACP methyl ester carboxylesterase